MPELDVADAEGMGQADTVVVSVPPPEGAVVAAALRERGFMVVEMPLDVLAARAPAVAPRVMIVDVDAPGAVEAIGRAREVSGAELVCVGDTMRAAELGASRAEGRAFERPLDLEALVIAVLARAEPAAPRLRATTPPSASAARETAPPFPAEHPEGEGPSSEYPSTSDPLDLAVILPTLDEAEGTAILAPMEFSEELSRILDSAEQRVNAQGQLRTSSIPALEPELDLLLPQELLASLDEPLDPDDGSASGASTGGTGYPVPKTGGATGAAGPTTSAHGDHGTGAGDATRAGRPSAQPTAAGGGPGSIPPFSMGAPPTSFTPNLAPPPVLRELEPVLALGPVSRAARIGVVPIPIESLPDRPVPDPTALPGPASGPPSRAPAEPAAPSPAPPSLQVVGPAPEERAAPARAPAGLPIPAVLGEGDAVRALSAAIAGRASGSLALGPAEATRWIVLHEGDIVTAASSAAAETLIAFLAARGDLAREVAVRLGGRLPAQGRHAGAALIAHGQLGQDDLWPVLRAHAEWIIGRALLCDVGTGALEDEPPGRLKAEPNVFGGATGAEVLLEQIRRVVPPDAAARRLGGPKARLAEGQRWQLLAECALRAEDEARVRAVAGRSLSEVLAGAEPELADVLYGLVSLGVLEVLAPTAPAEAAPAAVDPLDEEALRQRVRARVALVEDGDYFALLGVPRSATGYEVRRAYLELRRAFEPARVLTAATADLADDVRLVVEVLDEAYEILREPHRRERYRRAIEAGPP